MSLFDNELEGPKGTVRTAPLAERMRPRSLEEYSGQEHLLSRCASKSSTTTPGQ